MTLYGAIEAGGTKFVCAVGGELGGAMCVHLRISIPTTTPEETLKKAVDFFRPQALMAMGVPDANFKIKAMGIASFGPIDLHKDSPTYGHITTTPKAGWAYTDLVKPFRDGNLDKVWAVN